MATVSFYSLLFISSLLLVSHVRASEAQAKPPIVKGLSWTFYESSCPKLEFVVRNHLRKVFRKDIGQAPGLLRIFFHDCFVQGCDGSVLLDATPQNPSEKDTIPNSSLRPEALKTIDDLRALIHKKCGQVVSCSDITALAGRDAVFLTGGPHFPVPLGRRDGLTTNPAEANRLPSPFDNTTVNLAKFAAKKLDATDVVALSGAHSFGRAHCGTFFDRVSNPNAPIDKNFQNRLKGICPASNSTNTSVLDVRTPNLFDNKYYVNLVNRQGLFTSDQDLLTDTQTKGIVVSFAANQRLFFDKFANAMIKLSQLSVLTGNQGEIRAKCTAINNNNKSFLTSVVEEMVELNQF